MDKNEGVNETIYLYNEGKEHNIKDVNFERYKQERNKGDFTQYLLEFAKQKKLVILHTWVYKGMKGVILKVDLKNRVFTFFNATNKKTAIYSINIVRGIEEV